MQMTIIQGGLNLERLGDKPQVPPNEKKSEVKVAAVR